MKIMKDLRSKFEKEQLIKIRDVEALTGLNRVSLWRKSNDKEDPFPQAYRDGPNYTRWKLSEILNWRESLRAKQEEMV